MRSRGPLAVLATLLAGLTLTSCASGPRQLPPSNDIDEAAYREHLRFLASDDLEGRRAGTPGEQKTVAYLADEFRKLGLKPALGESFVQPVPMVEVTTAGDSALSVAVRARKIELSFRKDVVMWTERRDPQVALASSELVFVGFGIVAPEYNWNDYADADVRGKTVLVLAGDPGHATRDPKTFKGGAMTYYSRWSYKIDEAARRGAAAVLLIHDAGTLGFNWGVVQSTWTGGQLELASPGSEAALPAIEAWIQNDAARSIFSAAGLDFDASAAAAAHAGFKPVPISAHVDATLHTSLRQFTSSNVAALLPGSRRECVLYVAHWDHLGRDTARPGHNIFNGATENASGVAGLLTLAQSFARTHPAAERSILFLATTGGEPRSLGAEYYIGNPVIPLRDTAAVLNLDALHRGGPTRDLVILNPGNTDLEEFARGAALLQGREVTPEPNPEWDAYYDSDSLAFADAGVPVLFAKAGLDDSARGPEFGRAQLADYMANRYRQPSDQYAPDWDVRGAIEDLRVYFEVGNRVAHGRRFPRWYPNSEFRLSRAHRPQDPQEAPAERRPGGPSGPQGPRS